MPKRKPKQSKLDTKTNPFIILPSLFYHRVAAEEKEKRRLRDQVLKEQKEGSKRQVKQIEKKSKKEQSDKEFLAREEKRKLAKETAVEDEANLLPDDLLAQALIEEEEASRKRKHVSTEEFEKMIAEQEAEEKKKSKKRKSTIDGRSVGEYTVKVISNRPKLQKINKQLASNRKDHMHRKVVPRKEAVINISSGRDGAALVFRRKQ